VAGDADDPDESDEADEADAMKAGLAVAFALLASTLAIGFGLGLPREGAAALIHDLDVTRHRGRYELVAHTYLDAPVGGVYAVLTDYGDNGYRRISGIYQESGYLGTDADGTPLVYTLVKGCVAFFCKEMRRVSRLEVEPPNFIRTTALPARSDFKYSRSEWRLEAARKNAEGTESALGTEGTQRAEDTEDTEDTEGTEGRQGAGGAEGTQAAEGAGGIERAEGTEVTYRLVMEPDFWVPPLIGPWILERRFKEGGVRALERIERLARERGRELGLGASESKDVAASGAEISQAKPALAAR
jgi:hypothetical protein